MVAHAASAVSKERVSPGSGPFATLSTRARPESAPSGAGMEPFAIGVDIVELDRVRAVWDRHGERFLERILTAPERRLAGRRRDPVAFVAGRFAAKEAVLKALGTGLRRGIAWGDVEVDAGESGAPMVRLHGGAQKRARRSGIERVLVSIAHGRDQAVAQALAVGRAGAGGAGAGGGGAAEVERSR